LVKPFSKSTLKIIFIKKASNISINAIKEAHRKISIDETKVRRAKKAMVEENLRLVI